MAPCGNPVRPSGGVSFLQRSLLIWALALAFTAGCGTKGANNPGAQSPERQSDAEYDVALDLFSKGSSREALDHVRKAIELNEENEKALYLASAIHLSFCATVRGFTAPDCNLG